jgi:hypothetical protein
VSGGDRPAEPRSRGSVIAELLGLTGLALLAFFWIIPSQVSGGGLGLDPGFLPRFCVVAIALLILADGIKRLVGGELVEAYTERWSALAYVGAIAVLGAVILRLGGVAASALVTIPVGMLALGERRPILIIGATAVVAGVLFAFQR